MWLYIAVFSTIAYPCVGYFLWLEIECKHYKDGYTRWRKGSGKVYVFYWPIMLIKIAIKAFKLLWRL